MKTDEVIQSLVREGATLLDSRNPSRTPVPVGWWRRISPTCHFYHVAGLSDFDGHTFNFVQEEVLFGGLGVSFLDENGRRLAYLTKIAEQEDDPLEAERLAAQIAAWKTFYDQHDFFRAGVLGNFEGNRDSQQ